ncbi:hypothetical protein [Chondromyces apiculatus]|uniref:Uncharacterized protein n=1 Tax=Chondromyces apiculatus DSM 436 TaxID=1192034 RepID=A0A017TIC3_9BACT|nr:hypothetical protein [Chondromyces apiculatus]EYF08381.1 Hypothetical protein CAP_4997 [Chondromyces apiculatus DSM 436]
MRWLILVAAGVLGLSACRADEEGDRALGAEPPTPIEASERPDLPTMRDGTPSAGPATDVTASPPVRAPSAPSMTETQPRSSMPGPVITPETRSEGTTRATPSYTPPDAYRAPREDLPPGMPGGTQREMQPSEPRPTPEVPPGTRHEVQPSSPPPIFPPEGIAPGRDNGSFR